ncbi:2664_t:CDS:2 [Funneliformis caledonium]|uniref:2664_t:CDS:1 n=1 Tax=Funneliformis caledonium TaxID=1117310 RepID=A0A9N9FJ17_9GLOM|nr:2664_t:CDS:2 [Funneliformis caledonium]
MLRSKTPNVNALRDLTNKIPPSKKNKETQSEKKKVERKKMKDKRVVHDNFPDIEYCPPPMEEPPFEPDDEDLKIDFELFKHPPNFDAYEFENIIYKEQTMENFNENALQDREFMTEEELFGFDKLLENDELIFSDLEYGKEFMKQFGNFKFS